MRPEVSVITPFRNMASYLPEAVASVLDQTMSAWELLLVDDGSSDSSGDIAARFAASDPRIRLLSTSGLGRTGAAAARNVGLAEASGPYVSFLDADDLYVADNLERQLALAGRYPSAALVCGSARWWHPGNHAADWTDAPRYLAPGAYDPPALLEQIILLGRDQVPCTCAVLVRRDALRAVGGFEERLVLYEDQSLWVKLLSRYPAYLGTHLTSIYRQHEQSTSSRAHGRGEYSRLGVHPARASFLAWAEDYLGREERLPRSTRRALRIAKLLAGERISGLSVDERVGYAAVLAERVKRRIVARIRRDPTGAD